MLAAIVDTGGFRRAAEKLSLSQPAISQHIRHLARLITAPIFISTRSAVILSPEGRELLAYSRRMISLNDEIVERFVYSRQDASITMGVDEHFGESFCNILRHLSAAIPFTKASLRTGNGNALNSCVNEGGLELALILNQQAPKAAREIHHLGNLKLDWFGLPNADFSDDELPLVLFKEPCVFCDSVIRILDNAGKRWRIGYECFDLTGMRGAVKVGMGVTCLIANSDFVWSLPKNSDAALPKPPAAIPLNLIVGTEGPDGAVIRATKSAIRHALSEFPFESPYPPLIAPN